MFRSPQINFYAEDVEASVRFYRDYLGFTETFRTPTTGQPDHVELQLDTFTLGIASYDTLHKVHGIDAQATTTPGQARAELVLWTDDVDTAYANLVAQNATTLSPPHDFLNSLRSAWLADPAGNPIQLVQRRH